MKDYQVKSTTAFASYDLVLITEFAPNISSTALNVLEAAGAPWDWSEPRNTGTPGYAPCIIDAFTNVGYMGADPQQGLSFYSIELWHTTSVWHGDVVPGAYGVYTTSTTQVVGVE